MAEIERKDETKMRKKTSELYLFFSQPPQEFIYYRWRRINLKSFKFVKIHFWELSITYYLVKMSFQC